MMATRMPTIAGAAAVLVSQSGAQSSGPQSSGPQSSSPESGYEIVQASREFQNLRRRFRRFAVPAMVFLLSWYFRIR